ncbi:N-acetylmuramoyl-L-alanine amidase [Hominisplanchenecus murintestinalis]|uniref:N-acetylmuramoyl-L-alanine amidase n=1 Tax=Hominisplanchenecus murintestinalis TaxID=2941517 RepID=A0AC61QZP2_9FIRM|nr:peptidoglycan recognition family protein [Hominisplanchenecus murintestinalis]TGX98638.1 N-acetylmuramoyl-L-alanine amidase [Hominisplanchenecus murintestinalis]
MGLNIEKNYLTENRCYQTGAVCEKIGVQIHTIGTGQGTAQAVADYWNQGAVSACVHYCVDADIPGKVLQFLPENIRSWADAGWGNNHLITVEICESDYISYSGGANYSVRNLEKARADIMRGYQTAAELCAFLCKWYGWNPQAKLGNGMYVISSHAEGAAAGLSSNHADPAHIWSRFGLSMDGFRADVAKMMRTEPGIKPGVKVRLAQDIAVRDGVSSKEQQAGYVKYTELSASAKKKAKRIAGNRARVKKGTVVKILETKTAWDGTVWIRVKSGWLPVVKDGKWRVSVNGMGGNHAG